VIVDYCAHYAEQISKGHRFIDYPNAGLVATISEFAARGGAFLATAWISACFIAKKNDAMHYGLVPLAISLVSEEVAERASFLHLSLTRRAKCAAQGLIPAYHNIEKDKFPEPVSDERESGL